MLPPPPPPPGIVCEAEMCAWCLGGWKTEGWGGSGTWGHGGVCIIQVGPPDPAFTSLGSSEEQGIHFGGIEIEVEENTSKNRYGLMEWVGQGEKYSRTKRRRCKSVKTKAANILECPGKVSHSLWLASRWGHKARSVLGNLGDLAFILELGTGEPLEVLH